MRRVSRTDSRGYPYWKACSPCRKSSSNDGGALSAELGGSGGAGSDVRGPGVSVVLAQLRRASMDVGVVSMMQMSAPAAVPPLALPCPARKVLLERLAVRRGRKCQELPAYVCCTSGFACAWLGMLKRLSARRCGPASSDRGGSGAPTSFEDSGFGRVRRAGARTGGVVVAFVRNIVFRWRAVDEELGAQERR